MLRWGLLGAMLGLPLGCGNDSTTGPKEPGLLIDAQALVPSDRGCRLKATLRNRTGADLSGQLIYNLLDAQGNVIGSATVFPVVPDDTTRFATSDLLVSSVDGHRLTCSEIALLQVDASRTTVPVVLG